MSSSRPGQAIHRGYRSNRSLKGKVALVGGGAKNLGGLLSRTFAESSAKITVHYNSEATKGAADETVATIVKAGGEAIAIQGDLTKAANVTLLFDEGRKHFGRIDIAVIKLTVLLRVRLSRF